MLLARMVPAGTTQHRAAGALPILLERAGLLGEGYYSKCDLWITIFAPTSGFLMQTPTFCCQYLRSQLVN